MPVYQAPGVYVEEIAGSPPIGGVGTSTAAFIGTVANTVQMPFKPGLPLNPDSPTPEDRFILAPLWNAGTPDNPAAVLVTNFEQFKNKFGNFQVGNQVLAHAVHGFFLNGGSRCYVIRVENLDDASENGVAGALKELAKIDEIAIVAAPGASDRAVQNIIISHCKDLKDRFAILDGQDTTTITVPAIKGTNLQDSDYAALYFPRIEVTNQTIDPATNKLPDGEEKKIFLPPSGHVAGVYARVDQSRGVFKAPANEQVQGALGLKYLVTRDEQKGLNPEGINVIRGFDGNIKIYGARTLVDDNSEFKYINVRRVMNFLRESIDEGMQFVVFEPNTPALWQRILRTLNAFLTNQWRAGLLFGNTPEEAFFIKCDESLNPPEVRDLGQVITEIGVAIVRPAEFVIFRISQDVGSGT
jgi:uncharacterized protein